MTAARMQKLFNRHCLFTLIFFGFLILVMYETGEVRNFKNIFEKVIDSIMVSTIDLLVSLLRATE